MRQLWMARRAESYHVADSGNSRDAGPVFLIDPDIALLENQTDAFGIEASCHWTPPCGDEQVVGAKPLGRSSAELNVDVDTVCIGLRRSHLSARMTDDALLAKGLLELGRHRFVFDRDEPRQQFENGHAAPEPSEDRGEFH